MAHEQVSMPMTCRQQRAAKSQAPKTSEAKQVLVTYASQTGTAQEIAKGIQAESAAHGIQSKVYHLYEALRASA